jgi:23S rRNA pseudouridine2605 synthase
MSAFSSDHGARSRRLGVARILSKAGVCSRSEAERRVRAGRVTVNGRCVADPEHPVDPARDRVELDGQPIEPGERVYLMLNKPRGLVTTVSDERGRDTVYRCFDGSDLPWLAPVGRLDRASEGLLLFSNDPEWSARITDPASGPDKTYHVQIDRLPDAPMLARLESGVREDGEWLAAKTARLLRTGEKNAWLEIVLDEGRNRQIRRLLAAFDVSVLRLIRVAIGELQLGALAKREWRTLTDEEIATLARGSSTAALSRPVATPLR